MRTRTLVSGALGVTLAALLATALSAGCKPKPKSEPSAPAKAEAMDPEVMSPARERLAARPGAGPTARPATPPAAASAGPALALPAEVTSALGAAPEMVLAANVAQWVGSPLLKPLVASAVKGVGKEFGECAKLFDVSKLKKAWFIQSSGRFIKKREVGKPDPDSHYAAVSTDLDLPALFACLAKAGKFKAVKLNGQPAWQATQKPEGEREAFWFAPAKDKLVIVDGAWASKVTPGKGALGTGAYADQVKDEALDASGKNLSPEVTAFTARLALADPVVLHARVTMRGEKEAAGAAHFLNEMKKHPMARGALDAVKVTAKGAELTIAYQASLKDAQALVKLGEMFFLRQSGPKGPHDVQPTKEATKAGPAPRASVARPAPAPKKR